MWAEAILTKDDLEKAVGDFCPLTINLGNNGHVMLSSPRGLVLVPDVGLTVRVTGEVHWPILGIQIPVSVHSATLNVTPEIVKTESGETLRFRLRLADADVSMLPATIGRALVGLVNTQLDNDSMSVRWRFIETLSHVFELPDAFASARALGLRATWGA
jgi:hypothetical protein